MYLFHSHNIVGCLASIGDSDKMIHIPKEVHGRSHCHNRPQRSLRSLFLSSFIFLLCNITVEKKSLQ